MALKKEKDYVYKPKDSSGNDYAALSGMSDVHQAALAAAGKEWNAATTQEDKDYWHDKADEIRGLYGYSGGDDGSEYIPTGQPKTGGLSFNYGNRPSYQSDYGARIDAMLNQVLNQEKFSYDPAADPIYQQYEKMYTRNGQKAMEDTLAQVSARTGGLASSYAGVAAQQTYDGYMAELADKIPELRALAYEMYLGDMDSQMKKLGLLQDLDDTQYGRFRNQVGDWENDRDFAYGVYRDDQDEAWAQKEWDYALAQDQKKGSTGSGGGGGGGGGNDTPGLDWSAVDEWVDAFGEDAAENYIKEHYKELGYSSQSAALAGWQNHLLQSSMGPDGGEDEAAFVGSSGYNNVLATIDRAPGLTRYDKLNIVEDAYNNGRLSDEEAERLLDHIDGR